MKQDDNQVKNNLNSSATNHEIKYCLYAPVDGTIHAISKLNDGVFSEKTLGDGIYLIPDSNSFYSPLDQAKISLIAQAKHAFYFQIENATLLLHIGIDSVNLNGEPFKVFVKQGDQISHNSLVANVDLDLLNKRKISLATPLVLNKESEDQYKFVFNEKLEGQKVKQGELIGWIYLVKENKKTKENRATGVLGYVNQFDAAARTIYHAVGKNNFADYTNCMTRFRMQINDKTIVNEDEIKKIPLVKGLHWNGAQLQIIIGGDVVKVNDCFRKYLEQLTNETTQEPKTFGKVPLSKKILSVISSTIFPIFPVLIIGGVLKAIYSVLSLKGVNATSDVSGILGGLSMQYLTGGGHGVDIGISSHVNPAAYVFFVLGDLPFLFLAVFLLISVVRRFKGDILVGATIGLILSAPLIYTIGFPYDYGHLLSWSIFKYPGFTIANSIDKTHPLVVSAIGIGVVNLSQNIFVMLGAGLFYVWFDRWVKTWMPSVIDLFARHALCTVVTVTLSFTLFNIVMSFIQYILQIIVVFLTAIPFGLGALLYALMWQPLVITGAHGPIVFALMIPLLGPEHIPSSFLWGGQLAALAQAGAGFANGFLSKNAAKRAAAFNSAPVAVLGITEPVMYGVNLFNFKSFLFACLGSGIAGWFCGLTNVQVASVGALGILGLPTLIPLPNVPAQANIDTAQNVGFGALGLLIAFVFSFVTVFLFCREYVSTNKQFRQLSRLLKITLVNLNKASSQKLSQTEIDNLVRQSNQLVQETKAGRIRQLLHEYKTYVGKLSKLDRKLDALNKKEDQIKLKLNKKAQYYQKHHHETKLDLISQKFNSINFDLTRKNLLNQREKLVSENQKLQDNYNNFKNDCFNHASEFVQKLKGVSFEPLNKLANNYFNAINVIDISFDLVAPKENLYKKRELKRWLNKNKSVNVAVNN